jgi:hypothetical protein
MIHKLDKVTHDYESDLAHIGDYISFVFERPSDFLSYCLKWGIDGQRMDFEYNLAYYIYSLRSGSQLTTDDYCEALKRLTIPCDVPISLICIGKDKCEITIELATKNKVEFTRDPFYNTSM